MGLFKMVEKYKKNRRLNASDEYRFYKKNANILNACHIFSREFSPLDSFELVQSNIIIRALMNKQAIENLVDELNAEYEKKDKKVSTKVLKDRMEQLMSTLPYIQNGDNRIFVPIFSYAMNIIYEKESYKLLTYPYNELKDNFDDSVVDLFEIYNFSLYNSFFSKLILIDKDKTCAAFFSIDYLTIYFINDQGRLDNQLPLFDKYVKRINSAQVLSRAQIAVSYYFKNDKIGFIKELRKQKLISSRFYHKLLQKEDKRK